MSTLKIVTLATLALGAGLALAPSLYAQDAPAGSNTQTRGMGQGNTGGGGSMMGGDMGSMMKMMEDCNRMMQSMNSSTQNPPAPGQRG